MTYEPLETDGASGLPAPPPHPFDQQWFVYIDGKSYGPYTGHLLKEYVADGRIRADTHVCRVGMSEWVDAGAVPSLAALFPQNLSGPAPGQTLRAITAHSAGGPVVQITQIFGTTTAGFAGDVGPKNPGLALLLSFFIPGVGQVYNGHIAKGILMFVLTILSWLVLLGWVIWIWSMVDAYKSAKKINLLYHAHIGQGWPISR